MTDQLVFPDGSEYTFIDSPADPGREPLVMEFLLKPGCLAPPPHVHPQAQETFEVLEGAFELQGAGKWQRLQAGESLTVEPGQVHTFRNREGAPVRVRNVHNPGHSFERYLRRIDALLSEHGFTKVTPRAAMHLSMLYREHDETIRPAPALRIPTRILATIGRALRMRLPE
jgi:quercetin dioxygenase-like cupin family protein